MMVAKYHYLLSGHASFRSLEIITLFSSSIITHECLCDFHFHCGSFHCFRYHFKSHSRSATVFLWPFSELPFLPTMANFFSINWWVVFALVRSTGEQTIYLQQQTETKSQPCHKSRFRPYNVYDLVFGQTAWKFMVIHWQCNSLQAH